MRLQLRNKIEYENFKEQKQMHDNSQSKVRRQTNKEAATSIHNKHSKKLYLENNHIKTQNKIRNYETWVRDNGKNISNKNSSTNNQNEDT